MCAHILRNYYKAANTSAEGPIPVSEHTAVLTRAKVSVLTHRSPSPSENFLVASLGLSAAIDPLPNAL